MKVTKTLEFVFRDKSIDDAKSITAELFADLDAYYTTLIDKEDDETIRKHLKAKRKLLKEADKYKSCKIEKEFNELDEDELEVLEILTDHDSSVEDLAKRMFYFKRSVPEWTNSEFRERIMCALPHSKADGCRFTEIGRFVLTDEGAELKAQWKKDAENGN